MGTKPETQERLVGVWQLVEWTAIFADGRVKPPFGPGATGQLVYDASGVMSGFLQSASADGEHWSAFLAYSGPWCIEGDEVVHRVTFSSRADFFGTDLRRTIAWLPDGNLELTTKPEPTPSGNSFHYRLVWERA
jgi:hypothetical protein